MRKALWRPLAVAAGVAVATPGAGQPAAAVKHAATITVPAGFAGTVLVAKAGRIVLDRGYGTANGRHIAPADRFWIASSGKQFVAAAIMREVERGRVALDDPLARFFPAAPQDKAAITVRQLLSHTSGLGQSYVSENQTNRATAVARMLAVPLEGGPGSKFRYSNSNIQLAAAIVEISSGRAYEDYVRAHLWAPAGLRGTGFAGTAGARLVTPSSAALPDRLLHPYWGEQGVYSTTGDLWRWYLALQSGRLLKPASVATLFQPVTRIGEGQAGLGWFLGTTAKGNEFRFVRGNEDFGANSLLYAFPKQDIVIIILTHGGDADEDSSWSRKVLASIEDQLGL